MYCNGNGVPVDYDKAMDCFIKAVNKGNVAALTNIGTFKK